MKKLLIVISSVRENRIADNILATVKQGLADYEDVEVSVADLKELPMPFFNSPFSPSQDSFKVEDKNVIAWSKMVDEADAIIFLVAEYNYSITAPLKNAIDWVFKPWNGKPVAFVGYGWLGGIRAIKHLRDIMGGAIKAKAIKTEANLYFTKDIDVKGHVINPDTTTESIKAVIEELVISK